MISVLIGGWVIATTRTATTPVSPASAITSLGHSQNPEVRKILDRLDAVYANTKSYQATVKSYVGRQKTLVQGVIQIQKLGADVANLRFSQTVSGAQYRMIASSRWSLEIDDQSRTYDLVPFTGYPSPRARFLQGPIPSFPNLVLRPPSSLFPKAGTYTAMSQSGGYKLKYDYDKGGEVIHANVLANAAGEITEIEVHETSPRGNFDLLQRFTDIRRNLTFPKGHFDIHPPIGYHLYAFEYGPRVPNSGLPPHWEVTHGGERLDVANWVKANPNGVVVILQEEDSVADVERTIQNADLGRRFLFICVGNLPGNLPAKTYSTDTTGLWALGVTATPQYMFYSKGKVLEVFQGFDKQDPQRIIRNIKTALKENKNG